MTSEPRPRPSNGSGTCSLSSPSSKVAADSQDLADWLESNVPELEQIRDQCLDPEDKGLPGIEELVELRESFRIEGTTEAARDRLATRWLPRPARSAGRQSSWEDAESCRRMKELIGEYRDLVEALPAALRSNALLGVLPHIEEFVSGYEDHRRSEGVADFDDILIWARNVLRDNLDVRHYFQSRFQALLIDEFQDTDPIQVEIATYLTAEEQDKTGLAEAGPQRGQALRRRRSQAVDLPLPASRHRHLRPGQALPARRRAPRDRPELPLLQAADRVDQSNLRLALRGGGGAPAGERGAQSLTSRRKDGPSPGRRGSRP